MERTIEDYPNNWRVVVREPNTQPGTHGRIIGKTHGSALAARKAANDYLKRHGGAVQIWEANEQGIPMRLYSDVRSSGVVYEIEA